MIAARSDHSVQTINFTAGTQDFTALNTALQAVDWASNPNVRIAAIGNSWGYPGWELHVSDASFSVTTASGVPEPASWGMMLVGFGLLGATIRSRKTTVRYA